MYWRGVVYLGSVVVYSHPVNDRGGVELMRMRRSIALFSLSLPFSHSPHTLSHSGGAEGDVMRTSAVASRFLIANLPTLLLPLSFSRFPKILLPIFPNKKIFLGELLRENFRLFPYNPFLVARKRTTVQFLDFCVWEKSPKDS